MITMKELAQKLNLSTTTISNVINGKSGQVSKETVERVREALDKYNYVPNMTAVNLASKKSKLVGVGIINFKEDDNYLKDAFIGELLGSIGLELRKHGFYMQSFLTPDPKELLKTVSSWNVDGLILFGESHESGLEIVKKFSKPKVYIDSNIDIEKAGGVSVVLDDFGGGYKMGQYLIENGHEKIAFLAENKAGNNLARFNGLKKVMEENGLSLFSEDFIKLEASEKMMEQGLDEAMKLRKKYSVFFCSSDYNALSLLNYMRDRGVEVPRDISIVGFDGNIYSRMSRPMITTVYQNPSKKGEEAVLGLMKQMETPKYKEKIVLPIKILDGQTVARLN